MTRHPSDYSLDPPLLRITLNLFIYQTLHTVEWFDVCYSNIDSLKRSFSSSSARFPQEGRPRLDGEDGRLSVSHFTHREDRPMRLVQWAGPVTKPPRHHPGAAKAANHAAHGELRRSTIRLGKANVYAWHRFVSHLDTI